MANAVSPITGATLPPSTGRAPGARNIISRALIASYTAAFEKHGDWAMDTLAREHPDKFLQLGFGILPRDVLVSIIEQRRPGGLDPDEWALMLRVLDLLKSTIPPGMETPPAEVFGVLESALRAHYAKEIALNE